jgi:hypothetical protein
MECDLTRVETNISYTEDVKDFLLKGNKDLMHPRVRDTNPRQLIGNAMNQLLFDRVDVVELIISTDQSFCQNDYPS